MEDYYSSAKIGDPTFSTALKNEDRCSHSFFSVGENPLLDSPWACTRVKGHAPPHIAEGITRVLAIAPVFE